MDSTTILRYDPLFHERIRIKLAAELASGGKGQHEQTRNSKGGRRIKNEAYSSSTDPVDRFPHHQHNTYQRAIIGVHLVRASGPWRWRARMVDWLPCWQNRATMCPPRARKLQDCADPKKKKSYACNFAMTRDYSVPGSLYTKILMCAAIGVFL